MQANNPTNEKVPFRAVLKAFVSKYEFSLLVALIVIMAIMTALNKYFLTLNNFMSIGLMAAVSGTMAAGLAVYMLLGSMDLSQYSMAAVCSTVMGICCIWWGWPAWVSILVALFCSLIMGLINASLLTFCRIPPIIVTLGANQVYRGTAYLMTTAKNINLLSAPDKDLFKAIGQTRIGGVVPVPMLIMIAAFLISWFVLRFTMYGRQVYAVGANQRAAHLCGINVRRVRFVSMIFVSIFAGVAGVLSSCIMMTAIPATGVGQEVDISTSVMIGGLGVSGGGTGSVLGVFLGMLILMVINNGMTLMSMSSYYQQIVRGIVLLLAVMVDSIRRGGYQFK